MTEEVKFPDLDETNLQYNLIDEEQVYAELQYNVQQLQRTCLKMREQQLGGEQMDKAIDWLNQLLSKIKDRGAEASLLGEQASKEAKDAKL